MIPTTAANDCDFLFTFSSNHGSISRGLRDIDDVSVVGLRNVMATSSGHTAALTGEFDFQRAASY